MATEPPGQIDARLANNIAINDDGWCFYRTILHAYDPTLNTVTNSWILTCSIVNALRKRRAANKAEFDDYIKNSVLINPIFDATGKETNRTGIFTELKKNVTESYVIDDSNNRSEYVETVDELLNGLITLKDPARPEIGPLIWADIPIFKDVLYDLIGQYVTYYRPRGSPFYLRTVGGGASYDLEGNPEYDPTKGIVVFYHKNGNHYEYLKINQPPINQQLNPADLMSKLSCRIENGQLIQDTSTSNVIENISTSNVMAGVEEQTPPLTEDEIIELAAESARLLAEATAISAQIVEENVPHAVMVAADVDISKLGIITNNNIGTVNIGDIGATLPVNTVTSISQNKQPLQLSNEIKLLPETTTITTIPITDNTNVTNQINTQTVLAIVPSGKTGKLPVITSSAATTNNQNLATVVDICGTSVVVLPSQDQPPAQNPVITVNKPQDQPVATVTVTNPDTNTATTTTVPVPTEEDNNPFKLTEQQQKTVPTTTVNKPEGPPPTPEGAKRTLFGALKEFTRQAIKTTDLRPSLPPPTTTPTPSTEGVTVDVSTLPMWARDMFKDAKLIPACDGLVFGNDDCIDNYVFRDIKAADTYIQNALARIEGDPKMKEFNDLTAKAAAETDIAKKAEIEAKLVRYYTDATIKVRYKDGTVETLPVLNPYRNKQVRYDDFSELPKANLDILDRIVPAEMRTDRRFTTALLESLWHCGTRGNIGDDVRCTPAAILGELREWQTLNKERKYPPSHFIKNYVTQAIENAHPDASANNMLPEFVEIPKPTVTDVSEAPAVATITNIVPLPPPTIPINNPHLLLTRSIGTIGIDALDFSKRLGAIHKIGAIRPIVPAALPGILA